jgi:hypothetical protein
MSREDYNWRFGWGAGVFAFLSLLAGILSRFHICPFDQPWVAMVVIGSWALLPPIFFWIDWVWFFERGDDQTILDPARAARRDIAKHSHDLARNIWLGLLGILYVLFALKLPGIG